jgi:hypothetical protein
MLHVRLAKQKYDHLTIRADSTTPIDHCRQHYRLDKSLLTTSARQRQRGTRHQTLGRIVAVQGNYRSTKLATQTYKRK